MTGVTNNWQEKKAVLKIFRPGCFGPKGDGLPMDTVCENSGRCNLSADCIWVKTDTELGKDPGRGIEDMANVYRMVQTR
jgi:hypothetical protein